MTQYLLWAAWALKNLLLAWRGAWIPVSLWCTLQKTLIRPRNCHGLGISHTMTTSPKPPLKAPGWVMLWLAEEMLDGQHQRMLIPAHAWTAHNGLPHWKRISAKLYLMSPWWPNRLRDWTEFDKANSSLLTHNPDHYIIVPTKVWSWTLWETKSVECSAGCLVWIPLHCKRIDQSMILNFVRDEISGL